MQYIRRNGIAILDPGAAHIHPAIKAIRHPIQWGTAPGELEALVRRMAQQR
jgi:hypothetical protein